MGLRIGALRCIPTSTTVAARATMTRKKEGRGSPFVEAPAMPLPSSGGLIEDSFMVEPPSEG
jgi:hypothetical protein